MKKNVFQKLLATFAVTAVALSSNSFTSLAAANGGLDNAAIEASEVKPVITVSKEVITLDEAIASPTRKVTLTLSGGTDDMWASSGLHVNYDPRLEVELTRSGLPAVGIGEAVCDLSVATKEDVTASEVGMKGLFIATAGIGNYGRDGEMYTLNFTLPADVKEGDIFPIDLYYKESPSAMDVFIDAARENAAMQAYLFTKGIYNEDTNPYPGDDYLEAGSSFDGYIAIAGEPAKTEVTTVTSTVDVSTDKTTDFTKTTPVTATTTVNNSNCDCIRPGHTGLIGMLFDIRQFTMLLIGQLQKILDIIGY